MGLPPPGLTAAALTEPAPAQAEWAVGRSLGLASFPTLWLRKAGTLQRLPLTYDPAELSSLVSRALNA